MIKKVARYVHKRCYKSFDLDEFLSDLSMISWWDTYSCDNVEQAVDIFSDKFVGLLDRHAPSKTIQTRANYVPWLSSETKQFMKIRNEAQSLAAISNKPEDWTNYKLLRNFVTGRLRSEETNWKKLKLQNSSKNPAEQWRNVLGWLGWKNSGSPTQLFHEGKLVSKPMDIADCQNHYFTDKVKNILLDMPDPVSDPLNKLRQLMRDRSSIFSLHSAHPDEVQKIILQLKNSKSTGLDTIDSQIIKYSLPYILPAVTHIVNLSINSGIFPNQWKTAKVIPLLKSGDPLNPKNYRPVAMLPILSKVLEKVVFCQVSAYMENNGLMHPNHHGFRQNHSMTDGWKL